MSEATGRPMRNGAIGFAAVLASVVAVAASPAAGGKGPVATPAAHRCPGPLVEEVRGTTWRVRSIRATAMSCNDAARLIRRFLRKADAEPKCYRASKRPPPTRGCAVGRFHCWRAYAKYCARRGHDVSWRETRR
jgi:hypothetical protein